MLTELAVIRAFISKIQDDETCHEELKELLEQEEYLIELIATQQAEK